MGYSVKKLSLWRKSMLEILVLVLIFLPTPGYAQSANGLTTETMVLSLDQLTGDPGQELSFGLYARNIPASGMAGYQINVPYDMGLIEVISVEPGDVRQENTFQANPNSNPVEIVEALPTAITGNVKLATLKVKAKPAASGKKIMLPINIEKVIDSELRDIPCVTQAGILRVNYVGEIKLDSVQNIFAKTDAVKTADWSGDRQQLPKANLTANAGDLLLLTAQAEQPDLIVLPSRAEGILYALDGSQKAWNLPNLDDSGVNNQVRIKLPNDLSSGDYILTARMPSGKMAAQAISLTIEQSWRAILQLQPFQTTDNQKLTDLQRLTSDLRLPTVIPSINDTPLDEGHTVTVTWTSSNHDVLTLASKPEDPGFVYAYVHRPNFSEGNKNLYLTASLSWEGALQKTDFPVTVLASDMTTDDQVLYVANNFVSLLPNSLELQNRLQLLTLSSEITLPASLDLTLKQGSQTIPMNVAVDWSVVGEDGLSTDFMTLSPNGTGISINVLKQPTVGSQNEKVFLKAMIRKDAVSRSSNSAGKELVLAGRVLAEAKSTETLAQEEQALSDQISQNTSTYEQQIQNAQSASQASLDLAQTALSSSGDPTNLSGVQNVINQQLDTVVQPLLDTLQKPSGEPSGSTPEGLIGAASVLESTAQIASALTNNANVSDSEGIAAVVQTVEEIVNTLAPSIVNLNQVSDPTVQQYVNTTAETLQNVYQEISQALSDQNKVALDSTSIGDSALSGEAIRLAANQLSLGISGLTQALNNANILSSNNTINPLAVQVQVPNNQNPGDAGVSLSTDALGTLVEKNFDLALQIPGEAGIPPTGVQLSQDALQKAIAGAAGSGSIDINLKPISTDDEALQELAFDSETLVVPFSIEIQSQGTTLSMKEFSEPAWITLPIQAPMTVTQAQNLQDAGQLTVMYYSSSQGAWLPIDVLGSNLRIDASAQTLSFPTTHFTYFSVNTKSSEAGLNLVKLQDGNSVFNLDPNLFPANLSIPLSTDPTDLTLEVSLRDPAAGLSGNYKSVAENNSQGISWSQATPGIWRGQVSVGAGVQNIINLSVTAQDGTQKDYVINLSSFYILNTNNADHPIQGMEGQTYTVNNPLAVLSAIGGVLPYTWEAATGSNGLQLTSTGLLIGTPTAGSLSFLAKVTDSGTPSLTATTSLTVNIIPKLLITTTSLHDGKKGSSYAATLTASGGIGHYIWSLAQGSTLPPGLTLSTNGRISGIPTETGTQSFAIEVSDDGGSGQRAAQTFSLMIRAAESGGGPAGGGLSGGGSIPSGPVDGVWNITPTSEQHDRASAAQRIEAGTLGVIQAQDGGSIEVRTDAMTASLNLSIAIGSIGHIPKNSAIHMFDPVFTEREFGPNGIRFNAPVTIKLPYSGVNLEGLKDTQLALFWWNGSDWIKVGGVVDPVTKTVSATVYHFSTYAVMADTSQAPARLAGENRYGTAVAVSEEGWKQGAEEIVLVNSSSFPDALGATPLAYKLKAPILLTDANRLPDETLTQIKRLGARKITLIGGPGVISLQVEQQLVTLGYEVKRYGGQDRYETARQIAQALGTTGQAIIVSGEDNHYPDALTAASWAAYHGIPILYSTETQLPEASKQALIQEKVTKTYVIGGTGAVSESVYQQLPIPVRYGGMDRYSTAAEVVSGLTMNPAQVFIATGLNFVDALVAGNLAAQTNAPILLVDEGLPAATQTYLKGIKDRVGTLTIIGGTGVISEEQADALRSLVMRP